MTFQAARKHVLDDTVELVRTLGMATPLAGAPLEESQGVERYFRSLLARHVILVVLRLHEQPTTGRT